MRVLMIVLTLIPPMAARVALGAAKPPGDPSFRLLNNLAQPIVELFATPAGQGTWGKNRLTSPLAPRTTRIVHIARQGTCRFDLRIVLADHSAKEKHETNLCQITDLPVP
jgi:hypothetical protein